MILPVSAKVLSLYRKGSFHRFDTHDVRIKEKKMNNEHKSLQIIMYNTHSTNLPETPPTVPAMKSL